LVRASCLILAATQVTEQAVFLYPPFLLALALVPCEGEKKWKLGLAFAVCPRPRFCT
jgi:hypothetical protein